MPKLANEVSVRVQRDTVRGKDSLLHDVQYLLLAASSDAKVLRLVVRRVQHSPIHNKPLPLTFCTGG
jgi:hypothetical protein